ncbi:MAG TPA: SsrA-binding protein SmpB [Planctomycetes bacterium]|nr:SsrA-binding protein SmpB [Planctomycetota bacterium]
MARDSSKERDLSVNRKARHTYHILETLECGIVLVGTEVKSLREGGASIAEAYGRIDGGEMWLHGATIGEYSHGNIHNHAPQRPRKLLASKREIAAWNRKVRERGVTLVPLRIYFKGHLVKVEMALARGKKLFDKRQDQKKRSADRDIRRAMTRRR